MLKFCCSLLAVSSGICWFLSIYLFSDQEGAVGAMIDVVVRTETETGKTVVVVTIGRETVTAVVEIVTGIMGMTEIEKETGLVVMIQGVVEDHVHQPEIIQEIMTTEGIISIHY